MSSREEEIDKLLNTCRKAIGEKQMQSKKPLVWTIENAALFMRAAKRPNEEKEERCIDSRHPFWRHGKTWFPSFSPAEGIFKLHLLEKDKYFFASYTLEIGDLFLQSDVQQFDRGMCYGFQGINSEDLINEDNAWKFKVTITPCAPVTDQK